MSVSFKVLPIILLGLIFTLESVAQDARYSQYYSAPHRLNPATIGLHKGLWRAGVNYRSQWGTIVDGGYRTFSLMGDARLNTFSNDFIGLGLNITSDKAGSAGLSHLNIDLGGSYQKKLTQGRRFSRRGGGASFLSLGGQIGYGQRRIDVTKLEFSNQFQNETGSFNNTAFSGEPNDMNSSRSYLDLNAGVMWFKTIAKRTSVFAGLGIQHLNAPDVSFFKSVSNLRDSTGFAILPVDKLYTRWSVHAGGEIQLPNGSPISILPGIVLLSQGPSMELNVGGSMRYVKNVTREQEVALRLGLWSRLSRKYVSADAVNIGMESIVAHVGLDYNSFELGFSYDANISNLQAASQGRGAFEVSLIYTELGERTRAQGCPTF